VLGDYMALLISWYKLIILYKRLAVAISTKKTKLLHRSALCSKFQL